VLHVICLWLTFRNRAAPGLHQTAPPLMPAHVPPTPGDPPTHLRLLPLHCPCTLPAAFGCSQRSDCSFTCFQASDKLG